MNEEIENALKCLEMDMLDNTQIELLLNYIDKLQEKNQVLEKIIDLIIDDFQIENYFVNMTNKEVREYYKKRKELKE